MNKLNACLVLFLLCLSLAPLAAKDNEADITVFRPGVNPKEKNMDTESGQMILAGKEYTKQTGGKVTFIVAGWDGWQSKVLTQLAAGEPIDVIFGGDGEFPMFYTKGYVQPIEKFVNMKAPSLNYTAMDQAFKYDGHYYIASNKGSNHAWYIIYNKTLMDEEGIDVKKQPEALYKAGKWTWAAMREIAMKCTKDTTNSGQIDRWGLGNWWTQGFFYMNGVTPTKIDAKGQATLNFDDPRILEALNFLGQAKKEGWYQQDISVAQTGLEKRKVAMYMERSWWPSTVQKLTKDEIRFVPLPYGPGNKDKLNAFMADGYGIGAGSKKQKWAGKYIDLCLKQWNEYDNKGRESWPKSIIQLQNQMAKRQILTGLTNSVLQPIMQGFLGEVVWSNLDPANVLESYKPKAQAIVLDANTPLEKPERLKFKNISVDFEDGDISAFKVADPAKKSVSISLIDGDKAIAGKSLLVKVDSASDGEWIDCVMTDPEKLGIVGWRNYMISFDVKMIKDPPNPDSYIYAQAWRDKLSNFGKITQKIETVDGVCNALGSVRDVYKNGKFGIRWSAHFGTDFVLDNIVIEEVR